MVAALKTYRAKQTCRVGGFLRRPGETFAMPALDKVPAHLEQVDSIGAPAQVGKDAIGAAKKRGGRSASVPRSAQVGKDDIGAGKVTNAADVTSADMVK